MHTIFSDFPRRAALLVGVLAATFLLSGCFVLSVHPLHDEETTVFDPGLVGVWGDPGDPDGETWQFSEGNAGGYHLIIRENDSLRIRPGEDGLFAVHLADLGGDRFMDLYPEEPEGVSDFYKSHIVPGHSFWTIERRGDDLVLGMFSQDAIEDLVVADGGGLATVAREDVTVLTASTERLQAVLAAHRADLFPDTETLRRLQ